MALLLYLHRRLQSGVVSCEAPSTGFNALASLAGLAATCVWDAADQVVHAGLHYMRVYATMHICMQAVGWVTGAWRGQSVCSVEFHPNSCAVTFCGDFFAV